MQESGPSAADTSQTAGTPLERAIRQIADGEPLIGERVHVVGRGLVPIPGATSGAVALRANGQSLFIVASESATTGAAAGIADYLDRLVQMGEAALPEITDSQLSLDQIRNAHATFHRIPPGGQKLNTNPKALLVTTSPPSAGIWDELEIELGRELEAVFMLAQGRLNRLRPPRPTGATRSGSSRARKGRGGQRFLVAGRP